MVDETRSQTNSHAEINADRPRLRLEEDELGHSTFAETIAAAIASRAGEDGFVIAVHGKWGSGKTSAVNMVVDALERREATLEQDRRTIVARFNPWWFSEQKDLTRSFFSELNASIGRKLSTGVRDGLRKMAKRASGATDAVAAILDWTPAAALSKPIAAAIKAAGEGADDDRSLEEIRDDLAAALRTETRNIVIIIDDVDRLVAEEVRQIFRLVKSVADLPRVTYLLVFDRDIANRALERPADPGGPEWLEKIVQASFDLPPVAQTDINRLFVGRLAAIIGDEPVPDMTRWGNLLHGAIAPWLKTPRHVARLANAVAMAWPSLRGEVDVGDLVAIETMRLFEPALYDFVRSHPDELTGVEPSHGLSADREAFGRVILATVDPRVHERAKTALTYIFPRLDAVFGNTWHGNDWRDAERGRHVSSKRRFGVYFSLGLNDGIISAAELEALRESYADPSVTRAIVQTYVDTVRRTGQTRASVLLNALMVHADVVPDLSAESTARALLASADLFLNPIDGQRTPDGLPLRWAISFAIEPVLKKLSPSTRAAVIAEAVDGPSLMYASYAVGRMSREHGRLGEKEAKPESERSLPLEAVVDLELRLVARIVKEAENGGLLATDEAASLLYVWAHISSDQPVRDWIAKSFDQPGFAAWLMRTFTGEGTGHSFGDLVGRKFYTVNRSSVGTLLDADRLEAVAHDMIARGEDADGAAKHYLEGLQENF